MTVLMLKKNSKESRNFISMILKIILNCSLNIFCLIRIFLLVWLISSMANSMVYWFDSSHNISSKNSLFFYQIWMTLQDCCSSLLKELQINWSFILNKKQMLRVKLWQYNILKKVLLTILQVKSLNFVRVRKIKQQNYMSTK